MKTAKDLELLLLIKEHEKQKLQLRINQAINFIELYKDKFKYNLIKNNHLDKIKNILTGDDKE